MSATIRSITSAEKPSQSIIYVSPEMARRILAKNLRNRPISELHVQRLMREMQSGRWEYNGEAIKWSVDDVLLDGQHRMTALSRMPDDFPPIPFLVVRGLLSSTQDTMDQGRTRQASDQMVIDGIVGRNSAIIAGAIRVYISWTNGRLFRDQVANKLGNTEVVSWAREHATEVAMLSDIAADPRCRAVKMRPSVTLAIMLTLRQIDGEAQRDFAELLYSGAGLDQGSPILALREWLDKVRTRKIKTSDRDYIAATIHTWNSWRRGKRMAILRRPTGGAWTAENFPTPF